MNPNCLFQEIVNSDPILRASVDMDKLFPKGFHSKKA
jgi:hypothetical protein